MVVALRLKNLGRGNEGGLRLLLHDARLCLGLRWELDDDRGVEVCLRVVFAHLEPAAGPAERSCCIPVRELVRY